MFEIKVKFEEAYYLYLDLLYFQISTKKKI